MVYCIESKSTDPHYNLALEQFVFDRLDKNHSYFILWQNFNTIVVGKHQNTQAEINTAFVNERGISVVRRLSGGGAVYHDLGNLNFTFITDTETKASGINFALFCTPIQQALNSFGVPVEISGRNDLTVDGKKFSGNAQYIKRGRIMHHGTILYDSDLSVLSMALRITDDKIESKGIKSIKSRVANIRPYMKNDMPIGEFQAALKAYMFKAFDMRDYALSADDDTAINELKDSIYSQWNWNYGSSPSYNVRKERRIDGCGKIEVLMDVEHGGIIKAISFYGDFFENENLDELVNMLIGRRLDREELRKILSGIDISGCINNLAADAFLSLLFE